MWIIFSTLCMFIMILTDIIGKKAVIEDKLSPIKLKIMGTLLAFVIGMSMHFYGFGESGLAPWNLLIKYPIMLVVTFFNVFSDFLYILSLKYVGMTIMETIVSLEGVVIFVGLIIINFVSGNFISIKDMLVPARLILILLIMIFTVLLPNIEFFNLRNVSLNKKQKDNRANLLIGIFISLFAVVLGCGDSLITDLLLDSNAIGTVDITMTAYFSQILLLPIFIYILFKKSEFAVNFHDVINKYSLTYSILCVLYIFMGVIAVSYDAVRSEILYLTYPVVSILGAKIFLKEKYSFKQNVCIWIITLSAICFCLIDYIV